MNLATKTTEDVTDAVRQAAKDVQEQVRAGGEQAYLSARTEAERMAVDRRDGVASYAHDIADAFGSASSTLHDRGRDMAARLAQRAADEIDAIGSRVEGQDVGRVFREVEGFARRRPALFLGGAFLFSFALVHFLSRPGDGNGSMHRAIDADDMGDAERVIASGEADGETGSPGRGLAGAAI